MSFRFALFLVSLWVSSAGLAQAAPCVMHQPAAAPCPHAIETPNSAPQNPLAMVVVDCFELEAPLPGAVLPGAADALAPSLPRTELAGQPPRAASTVWVAQAPPPPDILALYRHRRI